MAGGSKPVATALATAAAAAAAAAAATVPHSHHQWPCSFTAANATLRF